MVEISEKVKAELQDWIENEVPVKYYVNRALSTPQGESGERRGIGKLKQPHENVMELHEATGDKLIVMANQKEIVEYSPSNDWKVRVRKPKDDIYFDLKPQRAH